MVHEPIISDELFEAAKRKRQETTTTGNLRVGRYAKHLLSGILKCPMCGSSMYADIVQWKNKDGKVMQKNKYQCGHYAKSKFGQCQKNTISAEWIEGEVIAYTKLLVRNKQFTGLKRRQHMSVILETKQLCKFYGAGENQVKAVNQVDIQIEQGEFVAIVGKSGSGKSTLLHMLGGLDTPTKGSVTLAGKDLYRMKEDALAVFRRRKIGFVFQAFNLVSSVNVWENIVLPEKDSEPV